MESVGIVTTVVVGALALVAVAVGLRSIPDVQRYLKIRNM